MSLIRFAVIAVLFLIVAFFVQSRTAPTAQKRIFDFFSESVAPKIPFFYFFKDNIGNGTLLGVLSFVIFANIPIIPSPPAEAYIIFAFSKGANPILLVLIVAVVAAIASSISYLIGRIFGPGLIEKFTKKPFKYSKIMDTFSAPIMFIVVLLPLPIPGIFPFIFGAYKSNYRSFVMAVLSAMIIRFSLVLFLFSRYNDNLPGFLKLIF